MPISEKEKNRLRAQLKERGDILTKCDVLRTSLEESIPIPTWLPLYVLLNELGSPTLTQFLEDEVTPVSDIPDIVRRCERYAQLLKS